MVWSQFSDALTYFDSYARLVNASGQAPDPPIRIGETSQYDVQPDVAFDGTHFFVVWENTLELRGRAVGSDGQPVGDAFALVSGIDWQKREPAVAWDGGEFLVVWRKYDFVYGTNDIVGQFVALDETGNATLIGPAFPLDPITGGDQFVPSLACWTGGCLVTWTQDAGLGDGYDVYGALVDPDGSVSAPIPIAAGPGDQGTAGFAAPRRASASTARTTWWPTTRQGGSPVHGSPPRGTSYTRTASPSRRPAPAPTWPSATASTSPSGRMAGYAGRG